MRSRHGDVRGRRRAPRRALGLRRERNADARGEHQSSRRDQRSTCADATGHERHDDADADERSDQGAARPRRDDRTVENERQRREHEAATPRVRAEEEPYGEAEARSEQQRNRVRVLPEALEALGEILGGGLDGVSVPDREDDQACGGHRAGPTDEPRQDPVGIAELGERRRHGERRTECHRALERETRIDRPQCRRERECGERGGRAADRHRHPQRAAPASHGSGGEGEEEEEHHPPERPPHLLHARHSARRAREREDRAGEHEGNELLEPDSTRGPPHAHQDSERHARQPLNPAGACLYSPAVPYLAAAAVLAAVYGTGMTLTAGGRIRIDDGFRRRLTVFSIGFAALSLICFGLGVEGAFDRTSLLVLVIVGAALVLPFLPAEARALASAWQRSGRERWLLVAAGAIVAFDGFLASAPPTSGDATAYHLAAPRDWLAAGHFFSVWWDLGAFQPFSVEMHFALARVIGGGGGAILFGTVLGGFSAACIYLLTRQLFGRVAAAVAALLWVGQGMFLWEATGGFVELTLSAFVALGIAHLVAFARSHRLEDAAWAGLAAGLAMGTKYHGLLFVPVVAGIAAFASGGRLPRRAAAVGLVLVVALVGLPWYLHNWVTTGNPVYPFYSTTLGGKYMDAASRYDLNQSLNGYGLPGIWRLPIFPIEFLLHTDKYERGYSFSPALFVLPLVGAAIGRRSARLLLLGALVYVVIWWEEMQQITRYLLPGLAIATPVAGYAAVELWSRRPRGRALAVGIAAVTVAPLVAITGLFAWRIAPGAVGTESQAHFVQRLTGTYDAFRWMDDNLPPGGRVLVGIRDTYWLSRPAAVFDVPIFNFSQPSSQTVARMRLLDVRYVAFFENTLPKELAPLRLRLLARLDVPLVTSRTLGRVQHKVLDVWAWCGARGHPCQRPA